jgi:hypothetical protein
MCKARRLRKAEEEDRPTLAGRKATTDDARNMIETATKQTTDWGFENMELTALSRCSRCLLQISRSLELQYLPQNNLRQQYLRYLCLVVDGRRLLMSETHDAMMLMCRPDQLMRQ